MPRDFPNIIDYVKTRQDTFGERGVCRVDSLVFSWLAYCRLTEHANVGLGGDSIALKELYRAEWLESMCGRLFDPASSKELLLAAATSPRFGDVCVSDYVSYTDERVEMQFSAMMFCLPNNETFVAFRGTDNTLVGWKEDFNMSFKPAVPSQLDAARYVDYVAGRTQGRLWCGGHSKGGNLAVYGGVMCGAAAQSRIVCCFSHDGPGFSKKTMGDPRWSHASVPIDKTIPQSSVIGMVFENQEQEYTVVRSHSIGFSQHDPFSWEVDGCDFARKSKIGLSADILDSSVNTWLAHASDEQREGFVDAIFTVMEASGQTTFADIKANWRTAVPRMVAAAAQLDTEDLNVVVSAVADMTRMMVPSRARVGDLLKRRLTNAD